MLLDNNYQFFYFSPIGYEEFLASLVKDPRVVDLEPSEVYKEWLAEFNKKSWVFYNAQYKRYQLSVTREFKIKHGLEEDDDPEHYGLDEEWQDWCERVGLMKHWDDTNQAINNVAPLDEWKFKAGNWNENFAEKFHIYLRIQPILPKINALWFNSVINNSPQKIAKLRALPYDEYCKTAHWHHVRAAMLLIHRAVCQEINHCAMDESWYFGNWEADIHVHHLNYTHRGNERYYDLVLLCTEHHRKWHENMKRYNDPKMKLIFN